MDNFYAQVLITVIIIIIIYFFSKWIANKIFKQIEDANKKVIDSYQKFIDLVDKAHTKNINLTENLINTLNDCIKNRENDEDSITQSNNKGE